MRGEWEWGRDADEMVALLTNQDGGSLTACPGGDITLSSARCSSSGAWDASLAGGRVVGEATSSTCHLGAVEGGMGEVGASLEVAELLWETPGLHTMATGCEATSTALQPEGELLELVFEVSAIRIFAPVSYHFSVCSPVGEVVGHLGQRMIHTIRTLEELEEPLFHRLCGFL
jgi:hypothetical protein